jgi:hypothetical protein
MQDWELNHLLGSPIVGEHAANAAAVLEGYRSGTPEYISGNTLCRRRDRVGSPSPLSQLDPKKELWRQIPGPRGIWTESFLFLIYPHFTSR